MNRRTLLLLLACGTFLTAQAQAQAAEEGPFFVYLGSFNAKASAQAQARQLGGWVLRTDLYRDLTPGYFAVVRGPFRTRTEADSVLSVVLPHQPDALVRHAGPAMMPAALGDPALLAAVLGDLTVVVSDSLDIADTCAPSEPYLTVVVGFAEPRQGGEETSVTGYWVIERTSEVMPIRVCTPPGD